MRQVLVDTDRESVQRLQAQLLATFPDLPAGVVLGAVTRARRDLARLSQRERPCEGLWDAVDLVARQRLLEQVALRAERAS